MANIVFDFDGTLADVKALLMEIGNSIALKKGWQPVDEASFDQLSRGSIREGLKQLGIPLRDVPYLLLIGKRWLGERVEEINLFVGIDELFIDLREAGHELFVLSTNSRKLIQIVLERHGQADKIIVLPSSGLFGKASAIKRFMRSHKVSKKDVWYVGDELRDIEAAKKAGVHSIAVMWGLQHPDALRAAKPDFVIDKPSDMIDCIPNLSQGVLQ